MIALRTRDDLGDAGFSSDNNFPDSERKHPHPSIRNKADEAASQLHLKNRISASRVRARPVRHDSAKVPCVTGLNRAHAILAELPKLRVTDTTAANRAVGEASSSRRPHADVAIL